MPGLREGENLLRVRDAVEYLKSCGLKVQRTAVYEWFNRGLEYGKAGGTMVTSKEALWRFLNRENVESAGGFTAADLARSREAARELERAGWKKREKVAK